MDNKILIYLLVFSIVLWIVFVGGIVIYLLGLWNVEM